MRTNIATLLVATLMAVVSAGPAQAALTQVNVRIEGRSRALFEGPILTEGHDVSSYKADGGNAAEDLAEHPCDGIDPLDPENNAPGATPTAASVDAMNLVGEADALAGQWYPGYEDYFVEQWGQEEENAEAGSRSWGVLVNNVFTSVGGCQYELSAGDEVLWIYNAFDSRPILGLFAAGEHYSSGGRPLRAQAQLDRPFEVEVAAYDDHGEGQPPPTPERTSKDAKPYEGARVSPVSVSEKGFETAQTESPEAVTTNSEGKASIAFTTPGWHRIMAGTPLDETGEEAAIRSNRLDVCVPAPGETGCGALPAEDEVRTPPRYLQKPAPEEHHEETHEETHTGGGSGMGSQPTPQPAGGQGGSASGSAPTAKSPEALVQRKRPSTHLASASISRARVVLKLTAAGGVTMRIARLRDKGHHRRWQTITTISINASKAGVLEVKLPRLVAGSYQVSISLAGAKTVVKTLTVPSGRR
jgi:hypothetical protein